MIALEVEDGRQFQFKPDEGVFALHWDEFYLQYVFKVFEACAIHTGAWLDVTDLVEPTVNDSRELVRVVRVDSLEPIAGLL